MNKCNLAENSSCLGRLSEYHVIVLIHLLWTFKHFVYSFDNFYFTLKV